MFENNPQPMWIFDTDTLEIIEANEAAVGHYGYTREEFASMTIQDLRSREDAPAMLENLARSPRMEHSGPWRHVKRDGAVIEVEVTAHEVNFMGRPARFVMATDVTDRERLAHQLAQTQRLESSGSSPEASPTTSTTCCRSSSTTQCSSRTTSTRRRRTASRGWRKRGTTWMRSSERRRAPQTSLTSSWRSRGAK
jgi:PAS domain S-box-containing protein